MIEVRDERNYLLIQSLDNGKAVSGRGGSVGRLRLKNTWIYKETRQTGRFHLVDDAYVGWFGDHAPRHVAQTKCQQTFWAFTTSLAEPAHLELCDVCALADYHQPTVYRFYDVEDRLLYVGCTLDVIERFQYHARPSRQARWWPLRARYSLTTYASEVEAYAAERTAIAEELPLYNRTGVPRSKWLAVAV